MIRLGKLPILASVIALVGCASAPSEPRPNLSLLKGENIEWVESGAYEAALAQTARPAVDTLERYLRGVTPQNFAIVFDIDETLVSNWSYLRQRQFALSEPTFAEWVRAGNPAPILPMRGLYARAQAYAIPIFLVTGRPESLRAATEQNLRTAGYWGWERLFMKPDGYRDPSIIPFKSGVRKALTEQGYDIILNVGDQHSDLAGGYARHAFKLPNPFYYIP